MLELINGVFQIVKKDPNNWTEEAECEHCKKETLHDYHCAGHERDSSGDYKQCTVCKEYSDW